MPIGYEIPLLQHTVDDRGSRRSIADALEVLNEINRFSEHSLAQVRTIPLPLPTGESASIVLVIGPPREGEPTRGVALPSSAFFIGRTGAGVLEKFKISRLDLAWVDSAGGVSLDDGTSLRAVNVVPTVLHHELTPLQKRIVYRTLALIPSKTPRYRGPATVDLRFLDYSTLYGLKLPSLKQIQYQLWKKDPKLRGISRQTIANALGVCGMRRPRSGRLAA